jgi:hypothetical protein
MPGIARAILAGYPHQVTQRSFLRQRDVHQENRIPPQSPPAMKRDLSPLNLSPLNLLKQETANEQ